MKIQSHKLTIPGEIEVTFLNYGGIIQSLKVPDRNGKLEDVVLGFDNFDDYRNDHPYFGALVGRYANRIAKGTFSLNGETYHLPTNNGVNSLHGGKIGFDKVFWSVEKGSDKESYVLKHVSADGDQGYPGTLNVEVTYRVANGSELIIDYKARTDKPTPVNLTNHSYFNLSGTSEKNILEHELWINAESYTDVDSNLIPTGLFESVEGAMDFRQHKKIGLDIHKVSGGYDHNYVLREAPLRDPKARVVDPASGRMLEVFTTMPGIQFYSGNFLDGSLLGKGKMPYNKYQGLCLETQFFPDSPNHKQFPDTILNPGDTFHSTTIYRFSVS